MIWRFLLVQEKHLLFSLVQNVIKTQELLEEVLERRLLTFWNRNLKSDWREVKKVLTFVLKLSLEIRDELVLSAELLVVLKVVH